MVKHEFGHFERSFSICRIKTIFDRSFPFLISDIAFYQIAVVVLLVLVKPLLVVDHVMMAMMVVVEAFDGLLEVID